MKCGRRRPQEGRGDTLAQRQVQLSGVIPRAVVPGQQPLARLELASVPLGERGEVSCHQQSWASVS